MRANTFSFSTMSRQPWTALVGSNSSSRKTTSTLRPWTPPVSARYFQYRSLLFSKVLSGNGAAPVTGAWTPIRILVGVTPVRSTGPSISCRGGVGGSGGGAGVPGAGGFDGDGPVWAPGFAPP